LRGATVGLRKGRVAKTEKKVLVFRLSLLQLVTGWTKYGGMSLLVEVRVPDGQARDVGMPKPFRKE
jgi:hypothetical protein